VRLDHKLARWVAAGLVSAEQAEAIRRHEESHRPGSKWVVWALASVGGLAVVAGIISLVAANWEAIPDAVKLAGGLVVLVALALTAREVGERGDGWIRDLLLLLHQGMVLAMIGLVAQVYHLSGHPWRATALAFAFAVPAAAAGRRALLADVAVYLALQSLWFLLEDVGVLDRLLDTFQLAFVSIAIGLAFATVGRPAAEAAGRPAYASVFKRWAVGLTCVPLVLSAFAWSRETWWGTRRLSEGGWLANHWPLVLLVVAAVVAGVLQARRRKLDIATAGAALCAALLVVGAVYLVGGHPLSVQILGFALFCATATLFTVASALRGSRAGVNFGTLALAGRVLAVFLELFEDLTKTGVGLIVTGLLLVGVAAAWWRLRVLVPVVGGGPRRPDKGDEP
jgi:hypothetical protein